MMKEAPIPTIVKSEHPYDVETVVHTDGASSGTSLQIPMNVTTLHTSDVILNISDRFRTHHDASVEKHSGNIAYRKLVDLNRDLVAPSKLDGSEKMRVAQSIVTTIRAMGGRFLECKDETEPKPLADMNWLEVSDARAAEVTRNELNIVSSNTIVEVPTQLPVLLTEDDPLRDTSTKSSSTEKKEVDPNMLINLSPDQTVNLNFPVGSKVLYNINFTPEHSDAQIGVVKSVSMDLGTRDMLYVIEGNSCNDTQQYFIEEELAFAPHSSVTIEVSIRDKEEKFEGEVLSCCLANNEKVKLYSVMVYLGQHDVRMFHGIRQKRIRHRKVAKEQKPDASDESPGEQAPNNDPKDKDETEGLSQPVLSNDSGAQQESLSEVATENFEVKEVQVPKSQSKPQQEKLCNISDGSTIPSTNEVPISQDLKSDADDSSSVPSSDSSSQADSLFQESTSGECEKLAAKEIAKDESVEVDSQYGRTPDKTSRVSTPIFLDDNKSKGGGNYHSTSSNGHKHRWGRRPSDANGKHRYVNDGPRSDRTKTVPTSAYNYNCDVKTPCGSETKQQKRSRSASIDNRRDSYRRNGVGESETNQSATKHNRDKSRERKRWTPVHGGIGSNNLISSRGSHIRFDAPTGSTQEEKRRRRY